MIIRYFSAIKKTKKYVEKAEKEARYGGNISNSSEKINMMIVIPVLREQNVIADTISYFSGLDCSNLNIYLCIAGSEREYINLDKYGFNRSTRAVVDDYCSKNSFSDSFCIKVYEAKDLTDGDRATQLNFAVKSFLENENIDIDIIGVYDADSRPTKNTLEEVAGRYLSDKGVSYQQPAFFLDAVNEMERKNESAVLIANAVYQNTWSVISEIPMWIDYSSKNGKGNGNYYFIGHGEFFPMDIYQKFKFPEHEVTDGIQIGYRLGLIGEKAEILYNYCSDDVPHDLKMLIHQHRRWYGGCMRISQAYKWCREKRGTAKKRMQAKMYWSQFRWAFTVPLYIINLIISIILFACFDVYIPFIYMVLLLLLYAYLIPAIAIKITPCKAKISFKAFACIPVAILIKCIGPNIYFFNKLFKRKNVYGKVER